MSQLRSSKGRTCASTGKRPVPAQQRGDRSPLPIDDWPFLYLPSRHIPFAYVLTVLAMAVASVAVLRAGGLKRTGFSALHAHLFCLGAAFLLMEVHAINRLALLFGSTWLVSAATIGLVLVLVVLANGTVALVGTVPFPAAYGALAVSLILSHQVRPEAALGMGAWAALRQGVLLLLPVYFAGLIFARSFRGAALAGPAIGANILGSVLGGWLEYGTMATGMRGLVLLSMGLYALSCVCLLARSRPTAGELPSGGGAGEGAGARVQIPGRQRE